MINNWKFLHLEVAKCCCNKWPNIVASCPSCSLKKCFSALFIWMIMATERKSHYYHSVLLASSLCYVCWVAMWYICDLQSCMSSWSPCRFHFLSWGRNTTRASRFIIFSAFFIFPPNMNSYSKHMAKSCNIQTAKFQTAPAHHLPCVLVSSSSTQN